MALKRPLPFLAICARSALATLVCASVFGLAPDARAQGIASNAEAAREGEEIRGDTRVADIDEIERGLYVGVEAGPNYYLQMADPSFVNLNPDGTRIGTRMGIRVGYDVLNNLKVDAFLLANFNEGPIDAKKSGVGQMTGDLAHFAPGVAVRFDYITTEDQRFFAYVRAGAGIAFWFPQELALNQPFSIHTHGALGVEYYTRLRHVSVALEADFQALLSPMAFGVSLVPTVKYTF